MLGPVSFFFSLDGRFVVDYATYIYFRSSEAVHSVAFCGVYPWKSFVFSSEFPCLLATLFSRLFGGHVKEHESSFKRARKSHLCPKKTILFISHVSYFLVTYFQKQKGFYVFHCLRYRPRRIKPFPSPSCLLPILSPFVTVTFTFSF